MKNAIKRTLALLLVFCLTLPLLSVMRVQASVNQAVDYNFYNPALGVTEGRTVDMISNGTVKQALIDSYPSSINNLIIERSSTATPKMGNRWVYSGNTFDYQGLVFWCQLNDWVAFKIKSPGSGKFNVSLNYYNHGNNTKECSVYILPADTTDIADALGSDTLINAANLRSGIQNTICNAELGEAQFEAGKEYIVVFKSTKDRNNGTSTTTAYMHLVGLTMTPVVSAEEEPVASSIFNGVTTNYTTADALATAINGADDGTEFTLLADELTTEIEIELPDGVTLDLNGKTLNATVDATQGMVTDTTDGEGAIVGTSAVVAVGDSEVALKQGNVCRIFDYELTVDATPVEKTVEEKTQVSFWFHVKMDDAAYAMLGDPKKPATGLTVGANMQWTPDGGATVNEVVTELADSEVTKWAGLMSSGDFWFYVNVTGFESLTETGDLAVVPTINAVSGDAINYSVK